MVVSDLLKVRHANLPHQLVCFGIVQDHDSGGVVLKQMNDNSIADACAGAGNYVDLCIIIQISW